MEGIPLKTPSTSQLVKEEITITVPDYLTILQETQYEFNLENWALTGLQSGFANNNQCQRSSSPVPPSGPPYWMMFSPPQSCRAGPHLSQLNKCASSVCERKPKVPSLNVKKGFVPACQSSRSHLGYKKAPHQDSRTNQLSQSQSMKEGANTKGNPVNKLAPIRKKNTANLAFFSPGLDSTAELVSALTSEEREVLESITAQGYTLQTAIIALQKTGCQAPDKTLRYLLACDHLCQLGYDLTQVEDALEMFQNCETKAEEFLQLLTQFDEMGFEQNVIKEVLLVHENHRERALEELMMRMD